VRKVQGYIDAVQTTGLGFADREALSPRAIAVERLLMGLRTTEGVAFRELAALGLTTAHARVAEFVDLGLVSADDLRLWTTPPGRQILDRLIADLMI
jgi:oxygen-independent coproporphyrinogen-3 oxidase